ncbi:MAG: CRISPR-associated endonuclease Cas3'' [bacterium]|nr:CRISPR-associated endonuclease Cas3'' [bacterium]
MHTKKDSHMSDSQPIAHAAKDKDGLWRDPHGLTEHLRAVASLASQNARRFNGSDWAYLAGLWHDLGKYRPRFQHYIRQASGFEVDAHVKGEAGKAPHSTAGALLACDRFDMAGRVLAYLIAGHHAGLYDWNSDNSNLAYRLQQQDSRDEFDEALEQQPPADILDHGAFVPDLRTIPGGKDGFALWVRMLFSCLVDADFLDTETYMNADKSAQRGDWQNMQSLLEQFDPFMASKSIEAEPTPVNLLRADILRQCREKAHDAPGLFSLTVPTGGAGRSRRIHPARRRLPQCAVWPSRQTAGTHPVCRIFRKALSRLRSGCAGNRQVA